MVLKGPLKPAPQKGNLFHKTLSLTAQPHFMKKPMQEQEP